MRAKAFADWIHRLHGPRINVRIERIIENASLLGRFGVWLYNLIQRHWPALHNVYFFIVELFTMLHRGGVSYGGRYYRKLLHELRPNIILSVHDSTNRGYFEDAKRILGPETRCITYCGEFSGGYGFSRNWVNPIADCFIARTHPALEHAVQLGIRRENSTVFHKFLPPNAFDPPLADEELPQLRRVLGLDPDRFTLFLATGGYGANHHRTFLRAILPLADKVQVIVVCGRNQNILQQLTTWRQRHPQLQLYLEGYSTRIAEFLQVSHAIVSRGGANTTMEALHFQCPILYNTLGGLMPQERCTVRYFERHNVARLIRKPADLHNYLVEWADFPPAYQQIKAKMTRLNPQELPHTLLRQIVLSE